MIKATIGLLMVANVDILKTKCLVITKYNIKVFNINTYVN